MEKNTGNSKSVNLDLTCRKLPSKLVLSGAEGGEGWGEVSYYKNPA